MHIGKTSLIECFVHDSNILTIFSTVMKQEQKLGLNRVVIDITETITETITINGVSILNVSDNTNDTPIGCFS